MKRCPNCERTYSDEQVFCTTDGAPLVASPAAQDNTAAAGYAQTSGSTPPPPTQAYGSGAAPGYQPPPPPGIFPPPPGGYQATNSTNKFQPALIGGIVLGLLSSIPYVNIGNVLCCMWVLIGGALATYLYIKKSPAPVQMGEGAVLGMIAGGIGFVISVVVGLPLNILAGNPFAKMFLDWLAKMNPEQGERALEQYERMTSAPFMDQVMAAFTPFIFINLIIFVAFGLLGGLLAVPLFEKRKGQQVAPPLPPPDFSGGYR